MNVKAFIQELPDERQSAMTELFQTIEKHLPKGFESVVGKGFIHFVVPLSIYPNGYHCTPGEPLPFVSLASQKSHIAIYHMGLYMMPEHYDWFLNEYPKYSKKKLDIGKSCIRFKKPEDIPFALIGQLMERISMEDYIGIYESNLNRGKK